MGVVLGKTKGLFSKVVEDDGVENVLVVGGSRSGKGIGVVIPTLLSDKRSMVVLDMGELAELTRDARIRMGQTVVVFDPMRDGQFRDGIRYNPLAEVRIGTVYEYVDVCDLVDLLVDGKKRLLQLRVSPIRSFLIGLILHVIYVCRKEEKGIPSFSDVLELLYQHSSSLLVEEPSIFSECECDAPLLCDCVCEPDVRHPKLSFEDLLYKMKDFFHIEPEKILLGNTIFEENYGEYVKNIETLKENYNLKVPTKINRKRFIDDDGQEIVEFEDTGELSLGEIDKKFYPIFTHPKVREMAQEILNLGPYSLSDLFSGVLAILEPFRDPLVADWVCGDNSEFKASDLFREGEEVTLYLAVKPPYATVVAPIMRMVLEQVVRRGLLLSQEKREQGLHLKAAVLFVLDDFTKLGMMKWVEGKLNCLGSAGMKVVFLARSIGQIEKYYGVYSDIFVECYTKILMGGMTDSLTAQYFSKISGGRFREDDLHLLGWDDELLVRVGGRSALIRKVRYYAEKKFRNKMK